MHGQRDETELFLLNQFRSRKKKKKKKKTSG